LKVIQLPRPITGSLSPVDGIGRVRIGPCCARAAGEGSSAAAPVAARPPAVGPEQRYPALQRRPLCGELVLGDMGVADLLIEHQPGDDAAIALDPVIDEVSGHADAEHRQGDLARPFAQLAENAHAGERITGDSRASSAIGEA
jgi:hypothetical protein